MSCISETIRKDFENAYNKCNAGNVLIRYDRIKWLPEYLQGDSNVVHLDNKNCRNCGANNFKSGKCIYCNTDYNYCPKPDPEPLGEPQRIF